MLTGNMELVGSFLPRFHVSPQRWTQAAVKSRKRNPVTCATKVASSFGESFPLLYHRRKGIEVQCNDSSHNIHQSPVSHGSTSRLPELSFNRLQPTDQELCGGQRRVFGRFVARGAALDEEYWTAAWLRAEAHWESMSYMRHVDSYKRKFAEQEFYALKQRCSGRDGNSLKCFCIVAVKKEDKNVRRTVLNSVVGTLDLSLRQYLQGETFPGGSSKTMLSIIKSISDTSIPFTWDLDKVFNFVGLPCQELKSSNGILVGHNADDAHKYGYISNVCVAKYARRQGIATNMLYLAIDAAISAGMRQLFVHVNADNRPAQEVYKKTGFELVEAASSPLSKDQRLLMWMGL